MGNLNKRGQLSGGLVTGLIIGLVGLIVAVIIGLTITSTLSNANLLSSGRLTTTTLNEAGWLNTTPYTLATYNDLRTTFAIVQIGNATSGAVIGSGNYTLSSVGVLTNASATNWGAVKINYTYQDYAPEELSTKIIQGNLTSGVNNVSSKIPTALLIASIVLILSILAVLVAVWQKIRVGGNL